MALSIDVHGFEAVTTKEWVKSAMEPTHWDRIVSIAETTSTQLDSRPGFGFSWVTAVVVDDVVALAPPEHLRALLEG